ncbi:MAG: hypothetical protein ABWY12_05185 [Burkholderiales bacterium]
MTSISGVDFEGAWSRRLEVAIGNLTIGTLGRADFVANKRAPRRPKDLPDLELLPPEQWGAPPR